MYARSFESARHHGASSFWHLKEGVAEYKEVRGGEE